MIENKNGAGTDTLPPSSLTGDFSSVGPAPDYPPAPSEPPDGSRGPRKILVIIGVALALAGAAVAVILATGKPTKRPVKPHTTPAPVALSPAQIASMARKATLLVVSRSAASGSSLLGANGSAVGTCSSWVDDAAHGLVVTNAHCLEGGSSVQVGYDQGSMTAAKVLGVDPRSDLAVLQVSPTMLPGLQSLQLAAPGSVHQGDPAYALGYPDDGSNNPLNEPFQLTTGSVSALQNVNITVNTDDYQSDDDNAGLLEADMLQTDAAINPGNSGGPLLNAYGQVIGMNTAAVGGGHTQGFAIKVEKIQQIIPTLASGQSIGYPGLSVLPIGSKLANELGIDGGLFLTAVGDNTSADRAGLGSILTTATGHGDVIVIDKVNDVHVTTRQEWVDTLAQLQSGETVKIELFGLDSNGHYIHGTLGSVSFTMP